MKRSIFLGAEGWGGGGKEGWVERFVIYQNIGTLRMQELFFWIGGLRWDTSSKILTEISFNRRQKNPSSLSRINKDTTSYKSGSLNTGFIVLYRVLKCLEDF